MTLAIHKYKNYQYNSVQLSMMQQSSGIDPTKINFTDLTGHERVGVVNRNTNERVCPSE